LAPPAGEKASVSALDYTKAKSCFSNMVEAIETPIDKEITVHKTIVWDSEVFIFRKHFWNYEDAQREANEAPVECSVFQSQVGDESIGLKMFTVYKKDAKFTELYSTILS
jgi:hypothetical protein